MHTKTNGTVGILDHENIVLATEIILLPIIVTELCPISHVQLMADHDVIKAD